MTEICHTRMKQLHTCTADPSCVDNSQGRSRLVHDAPPSHGCQRDLSRVLDASRSLGASPFWPKPAPPSPGLGRGLAYLDCGVATAAVSGSSEEEEASSSSLRARLRVEHATLTRSIAEIPEIAEVGPLGAGAGLVTGVHGATSAAGSSSSSSSSPSEPSWGGEVRCRKRHVQ